MFCVLYEFEVSLQSEHEFKKVWHDLTKVIKETRGGLGSRLHKDITKENSWIAYAQWPDKATWDNPTSTSDTLVTLRNRMKELCTSIRTVYELDMVDDLLVTRHNEHK